MRCYCSIYRKTVGGGGYAINIVRDNTTLEVEGETEAIDTELPKPPEHTHIMLVLDESGKLGGSSWKLKASHSINAIPKNLSPNGIIGWI